MKLPLYGTRDAAVNFQNEVKKLMASLGYIQSKYNASLYYNPITDVKVMVHGDDFIGVGERPHIQHFRKQLAHRFTIKDQIVGNRKDLKEENEAAKVLKVLKVLKTKVTKILVVLLLVCSIVFRQPILLPGYPKTLPLGGLLLD